MDENDKKEIPEGGLRINHNIEPDAKVDEAGLKIPERIDDFKSISAELRETMKRISASSSFGMTPDRAKEERRRAIADAEARVVDVIPTIFRIQATTEPERADLLEVLKEGKTVLILGAVGSGKSTLAFALAYQFLKWRFKNPPKSGRVEYSFYSEAEYFARLSEKKVKNEDFGFKESALKKSLLVFDDLLSRSAGNFEHSELIFLVDGRYKWLMPTIYTSNKTLNEIGAFDDRIASRLASGIVLKTDTSADYRLHKNH
jgi:DNA replication protein DnaC